MMRNKAGYGIAFLFWLVLCLGCSDPKPSDDDGQSIAIKDTAITQTYPDLYQAIFSRNADRILSYTSNDNEQVREQAWRALAQTPADDLPGFITNVKQESSAEAWFALSMHTLSGDQLRDLENFWTKKPQQRAGVSLVLGRQGDAQTLNFISDHLDEAVGSHYEQAVALALSRLMNRFESSPKLKAAVINRAFKSSDLQTTRSWLYGFYRGGKDSLPSALRDSLLHHWEQWGKGKSANVDQYIARIIGPPVFGDLVQQYDSSGTLNRHVQLGIELAVLAAGIPINGKNRASLKILLRHENPHVVQQALAGLAGRLQAGDQLISFIKTEIADDKNANPFVWLEAVHTLAVADTELAAPYADQLNNIAENNPYLYPQALAVWMKIEDESAFFNRLESIIADGDPLKSMYAVNALNDYRTAVENINPIKDRMRKLTFDALALGDRGVTYSVQPLLRDPDLFAASDFPKITGYLNRFELPGDIEVYQTFGALYKQRFEEQAQPVIDSLAALHYPPLNRSLQQSGWDVDVSEDIETEFREPNWDRLWELGQNPIWVLETEKGTIRVKMHVLSAPATVSAIDSLTKAGTYDGVPFHRVVPNFVIQGGDIERRDGFGGPDFTIPTEASEQEFVRGAAGIASAGPDTEGSQYFFMHQWKPHLNGRYTLFGNVIEGMGVVDRIVAGDRVEQAYWE